MTNVTSDRISLLAVLLATACSSSSTNLGNAELGISEFRATEGATGIEIVGFDAEGAQIARVDLRVGEVEDLYTVGLGRTLTVETAGDGMVYASVGLGELHLATPHKQPAVAALMLDPYVTRELSRWDFHIIPSAPVVRGTDYGHGGTCSSGWDTWDEWCGGNTLPPNNCCMEHVEIYGYTPQAVVCASASRHSTRACFAPPQCTQGTYPNCVTSDALTCPAGSYEYESGGTWKCRVNGSTGCSDKEIGALGCAVCTGPTVYSGTMITQYTSGTDTCAAVQQYDLSVTSVITNAEGAVTSNPAGISLPFGGGGTDVHTYNANTVVTLTADPMGPQARARYSGACTTTGSWGQNAVCNVTMSAAKSTTVTFECRPGFSCDI